MSNANANAAETLIPTLNGKAVRVTAALIRASRCPGCDADLFTETRVHAILPGCRKSVLLTIAPGTGKIHLSPLFGHNGQAAIAPEVWAAFVAALPVRSDDLSPVEITESVATEAMRRELRIATCPAVTSPAR